MEQSKLDEVLEERERCALLVESHIQMLEPESLFAAFLRRIANLIRSGALVAPPLVELLPRLPESDDSTETGRPEAGGVSESGTPPTPGP